MKLKYFLLILVAAGMSLSVSRLAHAIFTDPGGGGDDISVDSPIKNSANWNPPTNYYPDNAAETSSSTNIGGDSQPYIVVGNVSGVYSYRIAQIKIYIKLGQTLNVSVSNAGPDCHSVTTNGLVGPDYSQNATGVGPTTLFSMLSDINGPTINGGAPQTLGQTAGCGSTALFAISDVSQCKTFTTNNKPENYDGYCVLYADVTDNTIQGENSFRITTTSNNEVGLSGATTGYGFRDRNLCDSTCGGSGNHWTSQIIFSVDQTCNNTSDGTTAATSSTSVFAADLDANNTNWNPNLEVEIQQEPWNSVNQWTTRVLRGTSYLQAQSNGTIPILSTTFSSQFRYRLLLKNVGVRNTIFVGLGAGLSQIAAKYNLTSSDCSRTTDKASCTITQSPASPGPGDQVQITITATNTGTVTWDNTYYMKRVGPTYRTLQNVKGSVGQGQTATFTDTVLAPALNVTKTLTYEMFNPSGAVPNSCQHDVTSSPNGSTSQGYIQANCAQTTVSVANVTATSAGAQITTVPTAIVITDKNNPSSTYTFVVPNGVQNNGPPKTFNTFDLWNGMWPHGDYILQIYVQGSNGSPDSPNYPNDGTWFQPGGNMNGPFWYPSNINGFQTKEVSNCLSATCGTSTAPDLEPGQLGTGTVTVHFDNSAGRSTAFQTNDPNGYNFTGSAVPGLVLTSSNPQTTNGPISPWSGSDPDVPVGTDVLVSVGFRADWQGTFSVTLRFQSNNLSLPPSNTVVSCQSQPVLPKTRAFFQVNQGDLTTGGGFATAGTGNCSVNDPGYISPITPNYNSYSGGIRAFGNKSAGLGSYGQFGVLALGYNLGSSSGRAGLYSQSNAIFSDPSNTPGNYGGLLNASSYSAWHCIKDFFLTTRMSNPTDEGNDPTINIDTLSNQTQYIATGNVKLTSTIGCTAAGNIPVGKQMTLYVDGSVEIQSDICNAQTYDASTRTNVPFFALIVQGNITVDYNVKQMDGLFVAQPTNTGNGVFQSCADFCPNNTLVVNGSVLAQYVLLNREHGTEGPLAADLNGISTQPAEVFNYSPAMIIGQPYFAPQLNNLQSLFSLPPVF